MKGGLTVDESFKLIVTIVNKGKASKVVGASKRAGAEGGTILFGRGTAKRSFLDFLGINFAPEKEIILTLVKEDKVKDVLQAITDEVKLNKPGNGIGFVINIKELLGVIHLLKNAGGNLNDRGL
ncbi:P-II family nitrogen regulator [Thermosediminibacter oceani]|uniref:PII family protein n=1 Tax=Thermosediminibacter oceani (strain ATCC BAA-1034 / DSM 16646 / JW/IW-1228P) TaxID=555079 RepID=D9S1U9_THEOJ|nr:P-II family nitrogen regulator [Thermosediminibacter oceani]ADL07376.1 PII family protein [Thermosediminibacter oceani DSM 16646]